MGSASSPAADPGPFPLIPTRRNLGCSNLNCPLCKTCQRRRCEQNFASKYLAPCDVLEAKCGAQIYVVVVDAMTGQLVHPDIDDPHLQVGPLRGSGFRRTGHGEGVWEPCAAPPFFSTRNESPDATLLPAECTHSCLAWV